MNEFTDKLYSELKEDLDIYNDLGAMPVKKVSGALNTIRENLARLKKYVSEHPFKSEAEEIGFFKYDKPKFLCEQVFALEMLRIETSRPPYDDDHIKGFFERELEDIRRFFEKYKFLNQYYKLDATDLDGILFLRNAAPTNIPLPETSDLDPAFSTHGDFPFAKFIALERLQEWLTVQVRGLNNVGVQRELPFVSSNPQGSSLDDRNGFHVPVGIKWTGETINLVELAYGIWLTGQVNNGNASVTEIIEWLEMAFKVKIGKAHRRWQSISSRKRVGAFKYVDEVKGALVKRLEEEWGR